MNKPYFGLSKSKITAFEQCPRRLWLQTHRKDLIVIDDATQARLDAGNLVSEVACSLHPGGVMVEAEPDLKAAIATTQALIADGTRPIFEATFSYDGVLVRVDIMEPDGKGAWHIAEVKSSTSAKDYHTADLATQVWVMEQCGIQIASANVRHIDNAFVLESVGDYDGLFKDAELSAVIRPAVDRRADIVAAARDTLASGEPECDMGPHCHAPFACEFQHWCGRNDSPPPEWPISDFPLSGSKLAAEWAIKGIADIRDLPADADLSPLHEKIRRAVISGEANCDTVAVAHATQDWAYPRIWIDFETIAFPVPRWIGTGPWRQIPFQFSAHIEQVDGSITHLEALDTTGDDPRPAIAVALARLPANGAVIAWNASFERGCFLSLAEAVPENAQPLLSLKSRTVDLLPIARAHYYHRDQRGSWSIKLVLPTIAPDLDYAMLEVKDGGNAQAAYLEAIALEDVSPRRRAIEAALRAYCERDTWAMVAIHRGLMGG